MNKDAQRVAIAKMCPQVARIDGAGVPVWRDRYENAYDSDEFSPMEFDPLDDLNACHEMEKVLVSGKDYSRFFAYCDEMSKVLDAHKETHATQMAWRIHAPAYIRAEAFLRTLSLWLPAD